MFNFKKMAICVFSFFAFSSSTNTFGATRYAKIVVCGKQGAGKTTFINRIKSYFRNRYNQVAAPVPGNQAMPTHTTQLSYSDNLLIRYDQNGNFILDDPNNPREFNREVALNICDTVSDHNASTAVQQFISKGTNVVVILVNIEEFFAKCGQFNYYPTGVDLYNEIVRIKKEINCRVIVYLTHIEPYLQPGQGYKLSSATLTLRGALRETGCVFDTLHVDGGVEQNKKILDTIAKSVYECRLDNLPVDNGNVRYSLSDSSFFSYWRELKPV